MVWDTIGGRQAGVETAAAIRAVNSEAKNLSGGLANAWDDSYLDQVYEALEDLGGARPFVYLAVHPKINISL